MNIHNLAADKHVMSEAPQRRRRTRGLAEEKRTFWRSLCAPAASSAPLRWRKLTRPAALLFALYPLLSLATLNVAPNLKASPVIVAQKSSEIYYPGPGESWERRTPQQVAMDPARLN